MTRAAKIDAHLKRANRADNPNAVRIVVLDGPRALCLNEAMLDTWWAALPAVTKAEIYELTLGDEQERCIHCGCTQNRACPGGCAWLDTNHTVCSAKPCAAKYKASLIASLADSTPLSHDLEEVEEGAFTRWLHGQVKQLPTAIGGFDARR